MQLTKEQVKTIIRNAPSGVDKTEILDGLIMRGYDLEGVDNATARKNLQAKQEKQKYNTEEYKTDMKTRLETAMKGTEKKGVLSQIGENIGNLPSSFLQRGQQLQTDIQNVPKVAEQAGNSPLAKVAATGQALGHTAGNIAGGVMDLMGSVLSPIISKVLPDKIETDIQNLSEGVSKEIDKIPGMTPDIKRSLEDVFNTVLLLGGKKAEPAVKSATGKAITGAKDITMKAGQEAIEGAGQTIKNISAKPAQFIENIVKKPIPEQVKTTLNEIDEGLFNKYANTAMEAAKSNKNLTPLEIAGKSAQDALDIIQRKLSTIGSEKSNIMNTAKTGLQPSGNIILKFRQELQNYVKNNTLIKSDSGLVNDLLTKAKALGSNPKAIEIDKFIDYVQDKLYTSGKDLTIPTTSKTPAMIRQITGKLNNELKTIAPKGYSILNDKFSNLIQIRNELNSKLGKGGEKGGALMKRVFSPSDANTKQLFEAIKKETGIDLVNESTVAKFVMEVMGDARQLSLLEELKLPKLAGNPLDWLWDKTTKNFNTPEKLLNRARDVIKENTNK